MKTGVPCLMLPIISDAQAAIPCVHLWQSITAGSCITGIALSRVLEMCDASKQLL